MTNDSVRMDRMFANMSDAQIAAFTTRINKWVHIVIGVALIMAGIILAMHK